MTPDAYILPFFQGGEAGGVSTALTSGSGFGAVFSLDRGSCLVADVFSSDDAASVASADALDTSGAEASGRGGVASERSGSTPRQPTATVVPSTPARSQ